MYKAYKDASRGDKWRLYDTDTGNFTGQTYDDQTEAMNAASERNRNRRTGSEGYQQSHWKGLHH
jgi:hypothetical protein